MKGIEKVLGNAVVGMLAAIFVLATVAIPVGVVALLFSVARWFWR